MRKIFFLSMFCAGMSGVATVSAFPEIPGNRIEASQLRESCLQSDQTPDYLFCMSYIGGVLDGIAVGNLGSQVHEFPYLPFCGPDDATLKSFVDVVKAEMLLRPKDVEELSAAVFIRAVLTEKYPCDPWITDKVVK
ncbi:Rap1a/Tai family immunity protein [Thalassospira povalilytica]|uniref:Rap1a/Tai family immunity protein n=1 Tax=Thalassospira povalilytica TaxID=732237 RepID=UPI003AA92449